MNISHSSNSDRLTTKLASGTKNEITVSFCVHGISSTFHFLLKQIAEIYAEINSLWGYAILFCRLEIRILVVVPQTANFANFLQEITKSEKITGF